MKRSFNSLYEILSAYSEKWFIMSDFQFSLWDSEEIQEEKKAMIISYFQFSLWDSTNPLTTSIASVQLSILFMRFLMVVAAIVPYGISLSILFMRFYGVALIKHVLPYAIFQFSLWDSVDKAIFVDVNLYDFQFSLWDSVELYNML